VDDEAGVPASESQLMHSSNLNAPVRSVSPSLDFVSEMFLILYIFGIPQKTATKNPIYLFYERVDTAADGTPGKDGDKHYKCYLGGRKVFTITRAMKSSLNGK
jgi:hypothetical protein